MESRCRWPESSGPSHQRGRQSAESVPDFFLSFFNRLPGDHTKLMVLRAREIAHRSPSHGAEYDFKAPRAEWDDSLDALLDLGNPMGHLVSELGVVGVEMIRRLRRCCRVFGRPRASLLSPLNGAGGLGKLLEPGDVIHALNRSLVTSVENLRTGLETLEAESPAVLQIERNGRFLYVASQWIELSFISRFRNSKSPVPVYEIAPEAIVVCSG